MHPSRIYTHHCFGVHLLWIPICCYKANHTTQSVAKDFSPASPRTQDEGEFREQTRRKIVNSSEVGKPSYAKKQGKATMVERAVAAPSPL